MFLKATGLFSCGQRDGPDRTLIHFFPASEPAAGGGPLLTQDVLLMLRDQRDPVLPVWVLDVDVDEAVPRGVQVGAEREHAALVGHVRVLSFKVVHQFDPRQQPCRRRTNGSS